MAAHDNPKADRRCHQKLGALAWERELRAEIHKLAEAIREMDAGLITPHEVNDRIHAFHDGISRELWGRYARSDPSLSVYRAYYDGYLTDDDLKSATDGVVAGIRAFGSLLDEQAKREGHGEKSDSG